MKQKSSGKNNALRNILIAYLALVTLGMIAWTILFVLPGPHPECAINESVGPCDKPGIFLEGLPVVLFVALYAMVPFLVWLGILYGAQAIQNRRTKKAVKK